MQPHLIALDVDGTIVDYDDKMSEVVRNTLRRLHEQGHHLVIATGRSASGALEVANRLDLRSGYIVASNGSVVVRLDEDTEHGWEVDHVQSFDPEPALRKMVSVLPTALYMVEDSELCRWASGEFPQGELASLEDMHVVPFEELTGKVATRIVLRELSGTTEEFAQAVEKIGLHGVTYSVGWSNWLDIAPEGTSKASGLEYVLEKLDVPHERTIGAGDGTNDQEMMEWVAHGIAMGQAGAELQDAASVVTGTVFEDGLATALQEYFDL